MDDDVGVGVGPSERAPAAGAGGTSPTHRRRMSAGRKRAAVLRLLRGEDLELVSRGLGVTAAELSGWRDAFLAAGEASMRSRPADARDAEIGRLKEKVGELTMKALAVLLYALGNVSQGMIAELLGVSHVAVYEWVRAAGEEAPAPSTTPEDNVVQIDEMWHVVDGKKTRFGSGGPTTLWHGEPWPGSWLGGMP